MYITNVIKCAPPENKPKAYEFRTCIKYLEKEIMLLPNLKVVVTLGGDSFNKVKSTLRDLGYQTNGIEFKHGGVYRYGDNDVVLIASYHTSKYNINKK